MRRLRLLLLTALPALAGADAAALSVEPLVATQPQTQATYRFPRFRGAEPAATAINTWLQAIELRHFAATPKGNPFAAVWTPGANAPDLAAIDYQPGAINARYATVTLRGTRTGAEPLAFERVHSFDAATGAPIALRELLTPAGLQHLRQLAATRRVAAVRDYLQRLPSRQDPDLDDKQSLYEECLPSIRADGLDGNEFELSAAALHLSRPGCANAERRALDDLGRLPVSIPLTELAADWSDYGRCLAGLPPTAPPCARPPAEGLEAGVYRGRIGAAAATLVVGRRPQRRADVVGYFVDRDARWIELSGEQRPDGSFWFHDLAGEQSGRLSTRFVFRLGPGSRVDGSSTDAAGKAVPLHFEPPVPPTRGKA